jgi:hypothetical protein
MGSEALRQENRPYPVMGRWPVPAKALATAVIVMLSIGMAGALGQIVVHDIIPTFFSGQEESAHQGEMEMPEAAGQSKRGDLFASAPVEKSEPPFYETEAFIFALKFTHIHTFGMSGIFIVMGALVFFLDRSARLRTWLIVLPFAGIVIDLLSVWLKIFIDPSFFWLHIPGGMLFGVIFAADSILMLLEMWTGGKKSSKLKAES